MYIDVLLNQARGTLLNPQNPEFLSTNHYNSVNKDWVEIVLPVHHFIQIERVQHLLTELSPVIAFTINFNMPFIVH